MNSILDICDTANLLSSIDSKTISVSVETFVASIPLQNEERLISAWQKQVLGFIARKDLKGNFGEFNLWRTNLSVSKLIANL